MLGAFKDFGKAATDLNKREFFDKKAPKKATLKTKSADGVSFEGNVTSAGGSELNLNFKDSELELKNKIDGKGVYTVDATVFKVADGLNLKGTFVTPDAKGKEAFFSKITLGADYKTADLNSAGGLTLKFGDANAFDFKSWTFDEAVAFKVSDDLNAGVGVTGLTADTVGDKTIISVPGIKVGTTFSTGDIKLSCAVNGSFKSDDYGFVAGALATTLSQKVASDTDVAAEFSFGKNSDKAGFVEKNGPLAVTVKLGSAYKLSDGATLKSKLSVTDSAEPTVDFAWVQKVGSGSLTFSQQYAGGNQFGLSYTLDA
eukprot:TRINITY_DN1912_c0_g1_i1.p1 TRINITY_DN1912_c0_g1~~TRINITY_DN1912_c0_g1_i1.p1  ORF type:complete len:314 (+),score=112.10 TRINITY_DN1912_c0_g1_i1:224-1165(+)